MYLIIKFILVCLVCLLGVGFLYLGFLITYGSITEFKPKSKEKLQIKNKGKNNVIVDQELSFIIWNIGYAGLGKEMDFFYEGGKQVRPSADVNIIYLDGILEYIRSNENVDFLMLQEVDFHSKRSYKKNQHLAIEELLPNHSSVFAINYQSGFVPVPLDNPMGVVSSGLSLFSDFQITEATRISTPGSHAWPKQLFMLKRCFLEARFLTDLGKELVVLNIHNSAFSDEDELRRLELNLLRQIVQEEYRKGNYVVVGGDWNQNPPGMDPEKIKGYSVKVIRPMDEEFIPEGWTWVYDPGLPTNRDVDKPFDLENTQCTILDFFLLSPNIELIEAKSADLQFKHSDHQPVFMKIRLLSGEL